MSGFNDGKVLRSNETTLRLYELRELYRLLQQGENDFTDLEMLRDIGKKLKATMGSYYDQSQNLLMQARLKVSNGIPGPLADLEYSVKQEALDDEQGTEFASDVPLKMAEYNWILNRIKDKKFSGEEKAAERALNILDAIRNAKGFQYVQGKIWVKDEPNPNEYDALPGGLQPLRMQRE